MRDLYISSSGFTNITALNVTGGYGQSSSVATITCENTTKSLNDIVSIDAGYSDSHQQIFYGRIKKITRNREEGNITIIAKDILIDAADFFIVSDDPENPFKRQNISAEDLVGDLLGLANITDYSPNVPLSFTYGVTVPAEFNLLSVMDACNQVATVLAWHIYADVTTVRFEDIRPYYRTDADKFTDYGSHLGNDTISHRFCTDGSITGVDVKRIIETIQHDVTDEGLRNKVVVYGRDNLVKKAQVASPYLPAGFYKAAVIASPLIDSDSMAQAAANYNLNLFNRLTETCTLSLLGDASIKPRQFCEISDTFTDTSGYYFIHEVNHTLGEGGFVTRITCTK